MARKRKTRAEWIDERLEELGLTQAEFAERAGLRSRETLRRIRNGEGSFPRTIRNVEAQLSWADGSIAAIDEGGEPRVVDVDAVLRRPLPAGIVGQAPHFRAPGAPAADDFPALLRHIRQRMGPASFWTEVGVMQSEEEPAESDRPHAAG